MRLKLLCATLLMTIFITPAVVYAETTTYATEFEFMYEEHISLLLHEVEPYEQEPRIFITTANLNLRPTPCTSGERIALVPAGQRVEVTDFRCGEWFAVVHNGRAGYMYSAHLMELPTGAAGEFAAPGAVELLEWSEASRVMTLGTTATIIDVRTGLTYQVASFSNGRHADVEPLTAEDTAIMLQAFGGSWTWTPRPVLVLINGRTLAASINGMPHAGWTNPHNNMNGHVCLHFLGSRTHNNTVSHERDHQNAVMEAFNSAADWLVP